MLSRLPRRMVSSVAPKLPIMSCQGVEGGEFALDFGGGDGERAGESHADAVPDDTDAKGLGAHDGDERGGACAHGLEDGKVADVLDGELVEDRGREEQADDKAEGDGNAEVDADAGRDDDEGLAAGAELVVAEGDHVTEGVDLRLHHADVGVVADLDEDVADPLAAGGGEGDGVLEGRVDDRVGLKAELGLAEPDDHRAAVVDLEHIAEVHAAELRAGGLFDDDRVGEAEVLDSTLDHLRRAADEG